METNLKHDISIFSNNREKNEFLFFPIIITCNLGVYMKYEKNYFKFQQPYDYIPFYLNWNHS